jgi:hypothetical protein
VDGGPPCFHRRQHPEIELVEKRTRSGTAILAGELRTKLMPKIVSAVSKIDLDECEFQRSPRLV